MTINVKVADANYRAAGEVATYWGETGGWYYAVRNALGRDMAFSVILSRISRELRREVGLEEAKSVFRQLAETMDEAAKFDSD